MTDEQLATLAAAGDELAFRELRNRHRGLIFGIVAKRWAPGLTADDFAQESQIAFWDAVVSYEPASGVPFGAFANLVVTRKVDSALKLALRQKHRVLSDALSFDQPLSGSDGDDGASLAELVPSREPSVVEQLHQRGEVAAVVDAVAALSPLERESLIGRAIGESYLETEARIGIAGDGTKPKSVDNALQRARSKIGDALGVDRVPFRSRGVSDSPPLIGRNRIGMRATPLGVAMLPGSRRAFDETAEPETTLVPKTAEELRRDTEERRDAVPTSTSCLFCDWSFEGTAGECRDAAAAHRDKAHPDAQNRLGRRRGQSIGAWRRDENDQVAAERAEANRVRAEREDADRLAKIERGRQRDALEAMDAGVPQRLTSEGETSAATSHGDEVSPPFSPPAESRPEAAHDDEGTPMNETTVAERFGLKKFGRGYIWTREAMLEAVRVYAAAHGSPPSLEDSKRAPLGMLPSQRSAERDFADWDELVTTAGFTPKRPGGSGDTRSGRGPQSRAEGPAAMLRVSAAASEPEDVQPPEPSRPEHEPHQQRGAEPAPTEPDPERESNAIALAPPPLRDPIRTADIPYDAEILDDEARFLRQRADALEQIAAGVRALASASRRDVDQAEELAA